MPVKITATSSDLKTGVRSSAKTVFARPGRTVSFTAEPFNSGDRWQLDEKDDLPPHTAVDDKLTIALARPRIGYGKYTVKDSAGTRSEAWTVSHPNPLAGRGAVTALVIALVAVGLYVPAVWRLSVNQNPNELGIFATLTFILTWVLLRCLLKATDGGGLLQLFIGADRRVSTSKTQYLLWTFFITLALAYVAGAVLLQDATFMCDDKHTSKCVAEATWGEYLILLGVPAGAAVAAKGITSYKVVNGIVQKSDGETTNPVQLATDDEGAPDLIDVQYLVFNVITLVFVAVGFFKTQTLGDVPDILLGLTSAAAATYTLNKSMQVTRPVITAVTPATFASGAHVEIRGKNVFVGSEAPAVKLAGLEAKVLESDQAGGRIVVEAPHGMAAGSQLAVVRTAANIETEGYHIQVQDFLILGYEDASSGQIKITVAGGPPSWKNAHVNFDKLVVRAAKDKADPALVTVSAPSGMSRPYDLVVTIDGRSTPPFAIPAP